MLLASGADCCGNDGNIQSVYRRRACAIGLAVGWFADLSGLQRRKTRIIPVRRLAPSRVRYR